MAEYQTLTVISAFVLIYSLLATRLEKTWVNGAMVYVVAGMLLGPQLLDLIDLKIDNAGISRLAEVALAICLFTDSSEANLKILRSVEAIPLRLLLIGLPLTIALGVGVAWLLLGDLGIYEVALIGAMLAPTDAALGKAVVTNPNVPAKVRVCLNVESGLNDGICVPVVLLFIAIAVGTVEASESAGIAFWLSVKVIGIGAVVGLVLGALGSVALRISSKHQWIAGTWLQLPLVALALFCFAFAQSLGGSGFIASFVGGLTFGIFTQVHKQQFLESAEGTGDLISLLTWFTFGTISVGFLLNNFNWNSVLYASLSLTIVRMLPVAISLFGKGLRTDTLLFIGWFGPRGLASIVFLVMVIDEKLPGSETIITTVIWTILASVVLHGVTANPLASAYGARVKLRGGDI